MSDCICVLITVFNKNHEFLQKYAIKVKSDSIDEEIIKYPMENKETYGSLLPSNCFGPIVSVEIIEDVSIYE
jgi:hypothetical protein